MIEAIPASLDHLPILKELFFAQFEDRRHTCFGYLSHPGLIQFHWNRIEAEIQKNPDPTPFLFFAHGELIGYARITASPWHTGHYGIPNYKIQPLLAFTDDSKVLQELTGAIKALFPRNPGCVITTRLETHDTRLHYVFNQSGFMYLGTSIRMVQERKPSIHVDIEETHKYDISNLRDYRETDLPSLQALIQRSHRHSHFFREKRFPLDQSQSLFAEWLRKCANGIADKIYVIENDQKVIGFCTLLSNNSLVQYINQKIGIIDFIVVDESEQGKGTGKRLLNAAYRYFDDCGLIELRTMADNIGAIRFYQKNGFFLLSSDEYYHYWT